MNGSPSHPSRTSIDSTTGLTAAYRPPQKDYAAAYGALQDKYGPHGSGYPPEPVVSKSTAASPKESGGRMIQKVWSKIKSFFRKYSGDVEEMPIGSFIVHAYAFH
ncbi:hypothetical protein C8J57DRAFT_1228658 [Mycena rebaudengoi]|nr:hypothetical protein C8J57DRAFT_1228658 [Mycena rebaudengoi]